MRNSVVDYQSMYEKGFSTYAIAKHFNKEAGGVRSLLRKHKLLKPRLGTLVENAVELWAKDQSKDVTRQKGDHPFDLLIDGDRIDVKSSHITGNGSKSKWKTYTFQLHDKTNAREKNLVLNVDSFWLVFLDETEAPIFSVSSEEVRNIVTLSIANPNKSKYNLRYEGSLKRYLREVFKTI